MKPAPFHYFAPTTMDETLALLAENGDAAKILAGGQSLVPTMNFRLASPSVLIDINRVNALSYIDARADALAIGALTRQRVLERDAQIAHHAPLIAETMPFIAHPQIRNRGTLGGSLAHADPAAELPAVMVALNAQIKVKNQNAERVIDARDFFIGLFMTALAPDELITEIILPPLPARAGYAFVEVARRHGDFALAGVACVIARDARGACSDARIALLGVSGQPVDARHAAQHLIGTPLNADAMRAASEAVDAEIDPSSDIHASAEFRRHLAKVLTRRAVETAIKRLEIGD